MFIIGLLNVIFHETRRLGEKLLYNVSKEKRKKENNLPLCQRLVFSSNSDRA